MNKLSIVIPVYNEEKTILTILDKVTMMALPKGLTSEIIVVNDSSKDSSKSKIEKYISTHKQLLIKLLNNEKNMGKSQSVKKGILATTGDWVVIQDADLEYDPTEIADLLNYALEGKFDVVYGNRFGKKNRVVYMQNFIGNKILSAISNAFTYPRIGVLIPDMEVCYKMVRGEVIREVARTIESTSNFGFEPEITAKLSKFRKKNGSKLKFGIVPISYSPRTIAEGKHMKAFSDGWKALKEIVKFNLQG